MRGQTCGFARVIKDLRIETIRAPASVARSLAVTAQVNHIAQVEARYSLQIGIGCLGMVTRSKQHAFAHSPATGNGISAIIAQIMDALGFEEG